jgi:hypothetical protein
MSLTQAIIIISIPIILGAITIWLVFRNINRKYCDLFRKLVTVAREKPTHMQTLIISDNAEERRRVVQELAAIQSIQRVEIIKAGKKRSQLRLQTTNEGQTQSWHVLLVSNEKSWGILEFAKILDQ